MGIRRKGISYRKRVADINAIYDRYIKTGLSNRAIYQRYIYPVYGISERTFYNILKAPALKPLQLTDNELTLFNYGYGVADKDDNKADT